VAPTDAPPVDERWGRLIGELHANRDVAVGPRPRWQRWGGRVVAGLVVIASVLLLLNLRTADAPVSGPPGMQRAAQVACPLGGAPITAIEPHAGGYRVHCAYAPFGWPSATGFMRCLEGEWGGSSSGWGQWGDYGVSCTDRPSAWDPRPG
jgi:hypothetical protein